MKILGSFKALAHFLPGVKAIEIVASGFRCSQRLVFFETACRATPGLVMKGRALGVKRLRCLSLNGDIRHKTNSVTNPENRKGR